MQVVTPTRLVVYGTPSAQLKDGLAGLGPVYTLRLPHFSPLTTAATLPERNCLLMAVSRRSDLCGTGIKPIRVECK
jgi:hypothetical protein